MQTAATEERFAQLLDGFAASVRKKLKAAQESSAIWFEPFLNEFKTVRDSWRKAQSCAADDFCLLDVLGVAEDEDRFSRMLAWLLDQRIEKFGTHAQGNLGFKLFLKALALPHTYASEEYWVRREICGDPGLTHQKDFRFLNVQSKYNA